MLPAAQLADCRLLRATARVLQLPAVATATALTFLHRVHDSADGGAAAGVTKHHDRLPPRQELVCACIFLAAKVEEVHVSTNQLINAARVLADPSQHALLQALAPLPPRLLPPEQQHAVPTAAAADGAQQQQTCGSSHQQQQHQPEQQQQGPEQQQQQQQACGSGGSHRQQPEQQPNQQQQPSRAILTGDGYYAAKDALFLAEQVVLRRMRFQLGGTAQPHKHLLNFCRLLGLARATTADAVAALNDALAYTRLVCETKPGVLAAAALQHVVLRGRGGGATAATAGGAGADDDAWVRLVGLPPPAVAAAQQVMQQALYGGGGGEGVACLGGGRHE